MQQFGSERDAIRDPERLVRGARHDVGVEREHRRYCLAAALRMFARHGVTHGAAGHITARDPEHADRFWVNPVVKHFGTMCPSDLLLVDSDGTVLEGDGELNLAAFAIHSHLHAARPEVVSAAHSHSVYGKVWSTTGRLLDPLTQDGCAFFEDHAVFHRFGGIVVDDDEGRALAAALGSSKAAILVNHGLLTVGRSVEEAAWWFLALEDACRVQVQAETLGTPIVIEPEVARRTAQQVGSPMAGRLQFEYELQALDLDWPRP